MSFSFAEPVRADSLTEQITERLKEAIYSGELAPGEVLHEGRLADAFGVSRSPVRTALWELTRLGLIEPLPRRGVRVVRLTPSLVREVMNIRAVLEGLAAREAAGRIPPEELNRYLTLFEDLARDGKMPAEYPHEVGDFHQMVIEYSGSPKLKEMLEGIQALVKLIRYRSGSISQRVPAVVREHLAIARALAEGNAEDAERLMRAHITAAIESFLANSPECANRSAEKGGAFPATRRG